MYISVFVYTYVHGPYSLGTHGLGQLLMYLAVFESSGKHVSKKGIRKRLAIWSNSQARPLTAMTPSAAL